MQAHLHQIMSSVKRNCLRSLIIIIVHFKKEHDHTLVTALVILHASHLLLCRLIFKWAFLKFLLIFKLKSENGVYIPLLASVTARWPSWTLGFIQRRSGVAQRGRNYWISCIISALTMPPPSWTTKHWRYLQTNKQHFEIQFLKYVYIL